MLMAALCLVACRTEPYGQSERVASKGSALERIVVAADGRGFMLARSKTAFHAWGMNHGNVGRLMEDFWEKERETFAGDFREMKALGANVVRVHLQFGKFMSGTNQPNHDHQSPPADVEV